MIRVYGSIADREPAETHAHGRISIHDWMAENVHGYSLGERQPVSITVNGRLVVPGLWGQTVLAPADDARVVVQPAGGLDLLVGFLTLRETFRPLINALTPDIPKQIAAADAIDVANLRANTPRMGGTVPEILGSYRRYPDYLLPPRRFFHSERVQRLHSLMCVGAGRYDIPLSSVRIGDTPIAALGGAAEYNVYPPGADLSAEPAAQWWHNVAEVGGTATGNSGIELGTLTDVQQYPDATEYLFSDDSIIIPAGAGSFPVEWDNTLILRVENYRDYTISGGDTISGPLDELAFSVGDRIEIDGDVTGIFLVASISSTDMTLTTVGSAPVESLPNGPARLAFGLEGMHWRIVGATTNEVEVERLDGSGAVDTGWPGWDDNTSLDGVVYVDGTTQVGWTGPFVCSPAGETATRIEMDFFFPGGLARIRSDGDIDPASQSVEVQYREAGSAGAWTSVSYSFSNRTVDQIGYTRSIELPSALRVELRARRTGGASTSKFRTDIEWYGLRSLIAGAPTSYPWTTLAVRINDSSAVSAQSENQINVICTRILPELVDGEWTAPTETRDIAAGVGHVLRSIGYDDSQIDMQALSDLNDLWRSRGEYFDYVFTETTVREALRTVLRAGMAELTMQDGQIVPVRDGPRSSFERGQAFSPQNMTGPLSRSFNAPRYDDPDGVDVTFTDRATWTEATVECRLPGDAGERAEQITLDGVTDRTQAWRIGMRRRMEIRYRRWAYEFQTELEGLNASYLSYVPILDDLPEYGQSAHMLSIEPDGADYRVTVTEPLDWSLPGDFVWAFRRPDGTVAGPFPATQGGEYQIITGDIVEPWPDLSARQEPPHVYFGTSDRWCFPALIRRVQPTGGVLVNVEAVNYDDRIYQFDDQSPE